MSLINSVLDRSFLPMTFDNMWNRMGTDLSLTDFDPTLSFNRMSLENRWIPSFDMLESDKELMIMGDVPGVDRKDIKVEMEGRFLRISGVKEDELKKNTDLRWRFVERDQGTFNRRIRLPLTADTDKISAEVKNGVLVVKVQKLPQKDQPTKTITVE